jgi:ParB/RepB/Spo0J family partition protein
MPTKSSDRLAEIRARVARRSPTESTPPPGDAVAAPTDDAALAAASAHFLGVAEQIVQNKVVERIPVGHIAPDLRPEMRQARLLPTPDELLVNGAPSPAYREMVAELVALGQSLKEQQIQPIIVYPGASDTYPAARYMILVGQRRWTAAMLTGIEVLDAVVVDPPSAVDRVRVQYVENEAREEFSDMERAWALIQMKQVLGDAPWEKVETQFGISRSRRHELTRLLAFTAPQQRQIALLRLHETQIRSLHTGVRNQDLTHAQVDAILFRLEQIAAERAAALATAAMTEAGAGPPPRRVGIDGPTIARLVARAQRTAAPLAVVAATPTPRWLPPLRDQLMRTNQSVQRATKRAESLGPSDIEALLSDISHLVESLTGLAVNLRGEEDGESEDAAVLTMRQKGSPDQP